MRLDCKCRSVHVRVQRVTADDIRRPLATSQYILPHAPRAASATQRLMTPIGSEPVSSPACSHYFLDPLSWMKPELEQGKLDGRLECPKCSTNVGKYAWQGMRCSCGEWIVPGISLAKGRIDESKAVAGSARSMGIRMPPGAPGAPTKTAGHGNL